MSYTRVLFETLEQLATSEQSTVVSGIPVIYGSFLEQNRCWLLIAVVLLVSITLTVCVCVCVCVCVLQQRTEASKECRV